VHAHDAADRARSGFDDGQRRSDDDRSDAADDVEFRFGGLGQRGRDFGQFDSTRGADVWCGLFGFVDNFECECWWLLVGGRSPSQ
jgi:hypothetical protein